MRGLLHIYPDRKRCYRCRSYFGFVVVDGLYDSYECAGRPDPDADPELWPRQHYKWRNGQKVAKNVFEDGRAAELAARSQTGRTSKLYSAYVCGWCGRWHIGSLRPNPEPD